MMTTMTKQITSSLELRDASTAEIAEILRANYLEWASGLDKTKYYEWIWWQMRQPWAKRNYRYMGAFQSNHLVSSCKIYTLYFQSRGHVYKIAGVGAVFTPPTHRGCGYGSEMIDKAVDLCEKEDYDGMLLYSDIAPEFYGRSGFEELGDNEFHLWLDGEQTSTLKRDNEQQFHLSKVSAEAVPAMISHYRRYLARQSFGIVRDEMYWGYKLERERYLAMHSSAHWPNLEILQLTARDKDGGYAIFEHGGKILRALEIIGSEDAVNRLWCGILDIGRERKVELVRGWEGISRPDRSGRSDRPDRPYACDFKFVERDWAHPMLLPFNARLDSWLDAVPCPLLELDHF